MNLYKDLPIIQYAHVIHIEFLFSKSIPGQVDTSQVGRIRKLINEGTELSILRLKGLASEKKNI